MSLENSEDPFNIDYSDVARSVEQDDRRAVRVPGFCVIVLDAQLIDREYIRHFADTPLGYLQAMKWAVRMEEEDIHSEKTVAQLREEYEKELERSPLEHWKKFEQSLYFPP